MTKLEAIEVMIEMSLPSVKQKLDAICHSLSKHEGGFEGQLDLISAGDPASLIHSILSAGGLGHGVLKALCQGMGMPIPGSIMTSAPKQVQKGLLVVYAQVIKQAMAENIQHAKLVKALMAGAAVHSSKEEDTMKALLF